MLARISYCAARSISTVVYVDGSCLNHGSHNPRAGIGVYWGPGDRRNSSVSLKETSSDRLELYAAQYAIEQAENEGLDSLIIRSDSQYLCKTLNNWIHKWKNNGWLLSNGKTAKNLDILLDIDERRERLKVKFEWVPGHSGDVGNLKAHELAQTGAKKHGYLISDLKA